MSIKRKSFRRRLGKLWQRLNPVPASRASRLRSHFSGSGFVPQIEHLESRQVPRRSYFWVNNNWVVTYSPAGDQRASRRRRHRGQRGDGRRRDQVTGKSLTLTHLPPTCQDALETNGADDTIIVLARHVHLLPAVRRIASAVTIEGQNYGSGGNPYRHKRRVQYHGERDDRGQRHHDLYRHDIESLPERCHCRRKRRAGTTITGSIFSGNPIGALASAALMPAPRSAATTSAATPPASNSPPAAAVGTGNNFSGKHRRQ